MPELNKANRQTCDVDIRVLSTMAPFLFFDTANTTTAGLSADSVYAMAKGSRRIPFPNPMDGTMTIEAQVYPFKFFALLSDGKIDSSAVYAVHKTIKCETAGEIAISVPTGQTVTTGSVFCYPKGSYGDEEKVIEGSFASGKFTAVDKTKIVKDSTYEIGYMVKRENGVKKISFNNKKLPKDYYITQKTFDKDENGDLSTFLMTAYKASIQRSFDMSFSSEGDPASVTLTFDLLEDKDGNVLDMIEIEKEAE